MTSKIFRSTLLVAAVVLLCSLVIIMGFLYSYFDGMQVRQLKDELSLAATGTEQSGLTYLQNVESERFRLTWVAADGKVLFDTQKDPSTMENHADREEIREALESGFGSGSRRSATLTEQTIYEAKRLSNGSVLRISVSSITVTSLILGTLQPICVVISITIILSALLAHRMAKRIVEPLNRLDLEHPLENDAYEEITPLLQRINQQHLQLSAQLKKLKRKTAEFERITGNMREGLVLMDKYGVVVSINTAAKKIFDAGDFSIGKDLLTIDRSQDMRTALDTVFTAGVAAFRACRDGREYQYSLDRISSEGSVIGAVLLVFDVTDQVSAERSRREFSANVSHELKTPLQSIIGSAELLENGLVKAEDTPRFVGHIRQEASRLVSLIEDIIRLSQLDEGVALPTEEVDLYALAQEVTAALTPSAAQKDVSIHLEGESATVQGIRRLLYEIVYNLCDNAIKYNRPGGSVTATVRKDGEKTILSVSDTGIGIPSEHQERVFERFYRVDKSHSKQSGGTGLGLSIVKHAVQYHNAKLALESAPDRGTTITVTFA